MKKALALILALVLALSMAVSAFALTLEEITVLEDKDADPSLKNLKKLALDEDGDYYVMTDNGGTYYFALNALNANSVLDDIVVTATGCVEAEMLEFDPEVYNTIGETYKVVDAKGNPVAAEKLAAAEAEIFDDFAYVDGYEVVITYKNAETRYELTAKQEKALEKALKKIELEDIVNDAAAKLVGVTLKKGATAKVVEIKAVTKTSYDYNKALAKELNEIDKTTKYTVECNEDLYIVKVVIEPNYTTAYKQGKITIKATNVEYGLDEDGDVEVVEEKDVKATVNVVSDVAIFEYELVNWAGKNEKTLKIGEETGYSDYLTAIGGYGDDYSASALREYEATVISTTAFRALREEIKDGISVKANRALVVEIPEIAAGQKGVNFVPMTAANVWAGVNNEGIVEVFDLDVYLATGALVNDYIAFGFLGDQVVKGEFTTTVELPYNYYELREFYGEKVEEDDIVTYYLLKDGKVAQEIVVDYMTADIYDDVELVLENSNDTLGQYELRIDVEVEAEAGEENPNTGAESVVGVVAALAVVSVATAAAVSLKK